MKLRNKKNGALTVRYDPPAVEQVTVFEFTSQGTEVPDEIGKALLTTWKQLEEVPEPVEEPETPAKPWLILRRKRGSK